MRTALVMLTFLLDYIRDGIAMYSYMPEGDESRIGHVGMETQTGKRLFDKLAPGDDARHYAFMMMQRLDRCRDESAFPESGMVAWY